MIRKLKMWKVNSCWSCTVEVERISFVQVITIKKDASATLKMVFQASKGYELIWKDEYKSDGTGNSVVLKFSSDVLVQTAVEMAMQRCNRQCNAAKSNFNDVIAQVNHLA